MKIISFENNSPCDGHLLIPCRIYCVELEIAHNDLGLNAIEKCALKLKELEVKDEELKGFLGLGELDLLEPILEKIETKTLPEYKKIHAHFYYNLINQEFLHFVDLERVRTKDGKELENNEVEFFADSRFKAESLNPKENNKSLVNDIIIYKTIKTSITYHRQDTLRHAKVMNWHVVEGVYYLHAKAFNDSKEIRVECKNHPIKKMTEKLKETKWLKKWNKKHYTQTGESKPSKRIRVFKNPTAFDDRLDKVEYNLKNLDNNPKKLKICGALYDIYEQIFNEIPIFDEIPSLKGRDLETYKAKDLSEKSMRLGFEQISKDLNDSRLNALLHYEEKVMQALAKSYPSFLQDLHDLKKYRNKDKHGDESQDGFFLTRVELERYKDEIYFLVENLLKNPLIKERENAQKEKPYERKNAEIDAQLQLSNLNAPKCLFECFVGVNLAKAYYSKSEKKEEKEREKEEMILNFCKIFEITLFKAIQKQPKLDFKTKDELLRDYPNLGNSLREVREDFLKRAFEYDKTSLGAYVLVLLSCKYFESVFEEVQEVQEWLDFIARLIALRGHARKITQKLKELKEEDLEKLEKQALEYFKKIANKIYPKEKR